MSNIIGIDPGHGGKDYGSIGPRGNKEKDIVLSMGLYLAEFLKKKKFNVCLTRSNDTLVTIPERLKIINKNSVSLLLSIHLSEQNEGITLYIFNSQSESLANFILEHMEKEGYFNGRIRTINRTILRESKAPSVVIELGSMRSVIFEKEIIKEEKQKEIAQVLADAIEE
ncbi:MAG: N-acetylmuramoyl-L-alanine amidase, partial [Syntrophomonadaceae bacterium]|nr:N-acetylmuramoyl-L-alanine amidase [Syntrophomonadaceae bacterium]